MRAIFGFMAAMAVLMSVSQASAAEYEIVNRSGHRFCRA